MKIKLTALLITLVMISSQQAVSAPVLNEKGSISHIERIGTMILKIRKTMEQTKNIDALLDVGVPKKDVEEMKKEILLKSQKMIKKVLTEIRSL